MGGSRGDTSSPKSRIKAYVADLESGVLTTHDLWPTLTEADISKAGSVELPRVWSNVFKAEKPRSLLGLIGSENTLSSSTLKKPMKAVRKQLQKEY